MEFYCICALCFVLASIQPANGNTDFNLNVPRTKYNWEKVCIHSRDDVSIRWAQLCVATRAALWPPATATKPVSKIRVAPAARWSPIVTRNTARFNAKSWRWVNSHFLSLTLPVCPPGLSHYMIESGWWWGVNAVRLPPGCGVVSVESKHSWTALAMSVTSNGIQSHADDIETSRCAISAEHCCGGVIYASGAIVSIHFNMSFVWNQHITHVWQIDNT